MTKLTNFTQSLSEQEMRSINGGMISIIKWDGKHLYIFGLRVF